ncbi:MAG TPA: response regulator, partial [Acidimicrobiia bacterium]|nr:response regulator [Acidimicrobiia bacterium]
GVAGTWKDLTDNVNFMAGNLTGQVRNIAQVATAVARGDLSQKITVEAKGEVAALADTINTMVDQLRSFAAEVTRVARDVGTEGKLGGQATVEGVSGTWKDLTDNVNFMAVNLTDQVRNIAEVTTAVAKGELSKKITVGAKGEILELKNTINIMVDQLSSFAAEVTRVAREVGTEGRLGGQAEVEGVSGTWKRLTENVNQLAANLTTQVRAIAEVATAVTQGDLTRSIAVEAQGEVAELKDNINQMIANLKGTTQKNAEQDWLKTNLARIGGMMQGQRDLETVSRLIMSELTPVVSAQHGAFFLADSEHAEEPVLRMIASYGYKARKHVANQFRPGEGLVGQAALEKKSILMTEAPHDYIRIASGLGEASPINVIVLPVLFEEQLLAVIELASFRPFSEVNLAFLDQLMETIGIVLNTIIANMRTEELLEQSQRLTHELQSQSEELQAQQEELQQTNEELQEKAALLAEQNRNIEIKNREIDLARRGLEEKAQQLALSSEYKSEFLANMSHELRTPLNSLLILAKLIADNSEANLTEKQVDFARTIYSSGNDLLALINDILDLSKIEAGKMDLNPTPVPLADLQSYVEQAFRPLAQQKGLGFEISIADGLPAELVTDEQRLQQILKNLLANAFKFTHQGGVTLRLEPAPAETVFTNDALREARDVVALSVTDTGIGVPADKLRLIFEAFQQADGTTSRKYGGTGLGLSVSREIARLLGGEIGVESTLGEGSTFTLYLPAVCPSAPRSSTETSGPAGVGGVAGFEEDVPMLASPLEPDPSLLLLNELGDDRRDLEPGDRQLLVIESDADLARTAMRLGRERGFKVLAALRGDAGLALAREFRPDAVLVATDLAGADGFAVLDHLKRHAETRHIPVHVLTDAHRRQAALRAGAWGCLEKPVAVEALAEVIGSLSTFVEREPRALMIVDDDEVERNSVAELLGGSDVEITTVGSSEEAIAALETRHFDCLVLDLKLPKMTGFALLEKVKADSRFGDLPVIVYTGKELTRREETRLKKYAESVILKTVDSSDRLLDETTLFLHRTPASLAPEQRRMIEDLHHADVVFRGRRVLIVDDDVRNVFALTSALETRGMEVLYAENGKEGLDLLAEHSDVDLVLMDIMMPGMDG